VPPCLEKNNLYLKHQKCEFEKEEVEYLGVIVGRGQIRMDPHKVAAIGRWPKPKTVKDVQSFLGFCNFYRNFIEGFAHTAKPLWNLTQKDKPWAWSTTEETAFDELKGKLTNQPVLTMPIDDHPYRVEADASDYATGAVLSQKQEGVWKPIAFLSKALTATEWNYEIHDRELLAIMRALEEWHHYLQGAKEKIEIFTDHKNLEYFLSAKKLNRRQARWSGQLADYDYVLKHVPGKSMAKPDALSRRPDHKEGVKDDNSNIVLITPEHIASITTTTSVRDQIVKDLKSRKSIPVNKRDKASWEQVDGLTFRDGLIVIQDEDLKRKILEEVHDSPIAGHPGQAKS